MAPRKLTNEENMIKEAKMKVKMEDEFLDKVVSTVIEHVFQWWDRIEELVDDTGMELNLEYISPKYLSEISAHICRDIVTADGEVVDYISGPMDFILRVTYFRSMKIITDAMNVISAKGQLNKYYLAIKVSLKHKLRSEIMRRRSEIMRRRSNLLNEDELDVNLQKINPTKYYRACVKLPRVKTIRNILKREERLKSLEKTVLTVLRVV